MVLNIAGHKTGEYTVTIPVFEGPLDLLLQLIERAELDITAVSIAQVTDQFLAHIRTMEVPADEISSFLVMAARLIQIKSEVLLPRPPIRQPGEENPAEELARQLRIYKRFKEVAAWLEDRPDLTWGIVEQDVLPGMGKPMESARRNREYLRSIGL